MSRYTVIEYREVPKSITRTGIITGKTITEIPAHAGEIAVYVELHDSYTSWGYGSTYEIAEANAVTNALNIPR